MDNTPSLPVLQKIKQTPLELTHDNLNFNDFLFIGVQNGL